MSSMVNQASTSASVAGDAAPTESAEEASLKPSNSYNRHLDLLDTEEAALRAAPPSRCAFESDAVARRNMALARTCLRDGMPGAAGLHIVSAFALNGRFDRKTDQDLMGRLPELVENLLSQGDALQAEAAKVALLNAARLTESESTRSDCQSLQYLIATRETPKPPSQTQSAGLLSAEQRATIERFCVRHPKVRAFIDRMLKDMPGDDTTAKVALKWIHLLLEQHWFKNPELSEREPLAAETQLNATARTQLAQALSEHATPDQRKTYRRELVRSVLVDARSFLHSALVGHEEVKSKVLDILAACMQAPSQGGFVVAFVGPSGNGKTTMAKAIGHILGRRIVNLPCTGLEKSAVYGHPPVYSGAAPGIMFERLGQLPDGYGLFYMDEIDDPADSALRDQLSRFLDRQNNRELHDNYYGPLPINTSKLGFVLTFNNERKLGTMLRSRLAGRIVRTLPPTAEALESLVLRPIVEMPPTRLRLAQLKLDMLDQELIASGVDIDVPVYQVHPDAARLMREACEQTARQRYDDISPSERPGAPELDGREIMQLLEVVKQRKIHDNMVSRYQPSYELTALDVPRALGNWSVDVSTFEHTSNIDILIPQLPQGDFKIEFETETPDGRWLFSASNAWGVRLELLDQPADQLSVEAVVTVALYRSCGRPGEEQELWKNLQGHEFTRTAPHQESVTILWDSSQAYLSNTLPIHFKIEIQKETES